MSITLIGLGVYLLVQNFKGIKTANKGIRDCKAVYKQCRNETFLEVERNWKIVRGNDYMLIPVNLLIVIINMLNVIRLIISMV